MGPDLFGPRPAPDPSAPDELDNLLDYDAGMEDVFRQVDTNMEVSAVGDDSSRNATAIGGAELGIDEEIKVRKKRRPNPKLDEALLLSSAGIPKLRRIAKERLKFKGKGHEFSDVARLLSLYQLWLDDLYPKAKFADALIMVEKLGHSKRMQMIRKEWINEGKPRSSLPEEEPTEATRATDEIYGQAETAASDSTAPSKAKPAQPFPCAERSTTPPPRTDADEIDLYGVSPRGLSRPSESAPGNGREAAIDGGEGEPEEDELDALLAEQEMSMDEQRHSQFGNGTSNRSKAQPPEKDDFADEMEAIEGVDNMW